MPNFKKYNYDQTAMVVINFEEQLQPSTFEFTLHRLIDNHIDLSAFYEKYKNETNFKILSHTIDPSHDSIPVLKSFAERLGVADNNWHFLTGKQSDIYELGEKSYMVIAGEEESAPGGFIHSGAFMLVDNLGRIRGVYDGTDKVQVDILLVEIDLLLDEINQNK